MSDGLIQFCVGEWNGMEWRTLFGLCLVLSCAGADLSMNTVGFPDRW